MGCHFLLQWGGRNTANITGVWRECSQCLGHTGFARAHGMCVFLVYTAQAPGCSAGELSNADPGLRAFPRSKPLRFKFLGSPQRCRLGWTFILCPSLVQAAQATRCLVRALSLGAVHLITSPVPAARFPGCALRCAVCLFWRADLWLQSSQRMSSIQDPRKTWLATGSLSVWWRMPSLGLCLPLSSSGCHPPASSRAWASLLPASSPLVFSQSFVL